MANNWALTLRFFSYCRVLLSVLEVVAYDPDLFDPRGTGSENFIDVRNFPWFVDKTMLMHEIMNDSGKFYLLTYPRRWGKSINLHQIELYFSNLNTAKNRLLFEGTKINLCRYCHKAQKLQGKVPVIRIDFRSVTSTSGETCFLKSLKKVISKSFLIHEYLEHFVKTKYGENSTQLRNFRGHVQEDFPEFILQPKAKLKEQLTHEISKLEKYLADPTDPYQYLEQMEEAKSEVSRLTNITEKERTKRLEEIDTYYSHLLSYHQKLEMQKRQDKGNVVSLSNITYEEKNRLLAKIDSFYSPLLKEGLVTARRKSRQLKKEIPVRKMERNKIKKRLLESMRTYVTESIKFLALMLKEQTGKNVIIILDEYDAPVNTAFLEDCGSALVDYILPTLTEFMGHTFKDPDAVRNKTFESSVHLGVITGVFRIAKESMFSKVNNLVEYNMLGSKFCMFYGFTGTEVHSLYNVFKERNPDSTMKEEDLKFWYNGYSMPDNPSLDFYCPWAIVRSFAAGKIANYFTESGTLNSFHGLLSSEAVSPLIEHFIKHGRHPGDMEGLQMHRDDFDKLKRLKQHAGRLSDKTLILKLLFTTGYLTFAIDKNQPADTTRLKAANREIRSEFSKILLSSFKTKYGIDGNRLDAAANSLRGLFVNPDVTHFQADFKEILDEYPRFTKDKHGQGLYFNERSCHHVMENVGFSILAANFSIDFGATEVTYRKKSNETRRLDIIFFAEKLGVGLVIEMKAEDDVDIAVKEAEEKYSEYLDGFSFIKRKMFLGVNCELNKTVQMRIVVRDVQRTGTKKNTEREQRDRLAVT